MKGAPAKPRRSKGLLRENPLWAEDDATWSVIFCALNQAPLCSGKLNFENPVFWVKMVFTLESKLNFLGSGDLILNKIYIVASNLRAEAIRKAAPSGRHDNLSSSISSGPPSWPLQNLQSRRQFAGLLQLQQVAPSRDATDRRGR